MGSWDWNDAYQGDGSDVTPLDSQLLGDVLDLTPGKALDLGCGAGGNAIGLAERGWSVTGIDAATKAIASARRNAVESGSDAIFEVGDITTWQPVESYDLVLSSYALPPRGPQRDAALTTARAALAPGGTLVIGEWDADHMSWGSRDDFVTVGELVEAVAGLDVVRAESMATEPHVHAHDPGHGISNDDRPRVVIVVARRAAE